MLPGNHYMFSLAGWETVGILVVVIAMLVSNRIRIDVIGVFILLALGLTGVVKENRLFDGFGNEAVIVIACMLTLGSALMESGVTDAIASWIARVSGRSERRLLSILMAVGGVLSSVISDLAIVSIFLPVVRGFEQRLKVQSSRILLPLAIASMMGGLMTMVGSTSSIVANQISDQSGLGMLPLFTIAPIGFVLLVTTIFFVIGFGAFLLPKVDAVNDAGQVGVHEYLTELLVTDNSSWNNCALKDIHFFRDHGINVVQILRAHPVDFPQADTVLDAGDILLVQAHRDNLLKLSSTSNYSVQSTVHKSLEDATVGLAAEVIVRDRSEFAGLTLKQTQFRERYKVTVLAVWRNGQAISERLADIRLSVGDMLLVHGPTQSIEDLSRHEGLLMLSKTLHAPAVLRKGKLAVTILAMTFLLAALKLLPISLAGMLGVLLMIVFGILRVSQVYRAVEWHVLVFVAAMIPLGEAMSKTGILKFISSQLVSLFGHANPHVLLAVCFVLTALLTQVMSNTPTTLLLTPVMIETAKSLHYSPIPFVITVIIAVTASPVTYISHKAFLLVMGPGGYRYLDYVRLGVPLTLIYFVITMGLVPVLWPF